LTELVSPASNARVISYKRHFFVCQTSRPENGPKPSCAANGSAQLYSRLLTALDEPCPDAAAVARKPALDQHRRRPPVLILAARKPCSGA